MIFTLYVVVMIVVHHDQLKKSDIVYDLLLVSLLSDGEKENIYKSLPTQ